MLNFSKNEIITLVPHAGDHSGKRRFGFIGANTKSSFQIVFEREGALLQYSVKPKEAESLVSKLMVRKEVYQLKDIKGDSPKLAQHLRSELSPAPSKGDIVAFTEEGVRLTGRVVKGGEQPTVVVSLESQFQGHKSTFEVLDTPPNPTPELSDYEVTKHKIVSGHDDSEPYQAVITHKGKPVISASNDGWGGPDLFRDLKSGASDALSDLIRTQFNSDAFQVVSPLEYFVVWDWYLKPSGQSFQSFVERS